MSSRSGFLVVGAGIGGLACALAVAQRGFSVQVLEQASELTAVGAGIQLGPNATRMLRALGVLDAVLAKAALPQAICARASGSGKVLASLDLLAASSRYGAPYLTVLRADLQQVLVNAVQAAGVPLVLAAPVAWAGVATARDAAQAGPGETRRPQWVNAAQLLAAHGAHGLVVADGVWGRLGSATGQAVQTGHWAWRALLPMAAVPKELQAKRVSAWLGPAHHVVTYPTGLGDWLNLVAFTLSGTAPVRQEGAALSSGQTWALAGDAQQCVQALTANGQSLYGPLRKALELATSVSRWPVWVRPPLKSASQMAVGLVAAVGDAAHAMHPYMAQGAGMALEDAVELAVCAERNPQDVATAFQAYAHARWARNARVQAKAARNGRIFHASGAVAWARDAALALHPQLMDVPWLYAYDAVTENAAKHP